ncbi:hypothetical protein MRX96_022116 [Rhipicephalus microplus]|uniref:Uncharacterized protein n=1 Tax=Rhipicephalus microplus TaxID=6941 RepID=A0A9J6ERP7_RHIMP|nr:hypothetical protein HPB51_008498 [Rhipicephalus microplus]
MVSSFYIDEAAALRNVFKVIAACDHVTSVRLYLEFYDEQAYASLAAYVRGASSLKEIDLAIEIAYLDGEEDAVKGYDERQRSLSNLCKALSSNVEISTINFTSTIEIGNDDCQELADAALNNRHLHELSVNCMSESYVPVFLDRLLSRLAQCYNLLLLRVQTCDARDKLRDVQDILRRNCSLVERATRFVMGEHVPYCAHAFQVVSEEPALVFNV